jgi:YggT family protein
MENLLISLINAVVVTMWLAILARSLMSWFPGSQNTPVAQFLYQITEPILAPLRRIVPRIGMIDITPLVAILLLFFIQALANRMLTS